MSSASNKHPFIIGDRVTAGRDWNPRIADHLLADRNEPGEGRVVELLWGWPYVEWDSGGFQLFYYGRDGKYEIRKISETNRVSAEYVGTNWDNADVSKMELPEGER